MILSIYEKEQYIKNLLKYINSLSIRDKNSILEEENSLREFFGKALYNTFDEYLNQLIKEFDKNKVSINSNHLPKDVLESRLRAYNDNINHKSGDVLVSSRVRIRNFI